MPFLDPQGQTRRIAWLTRSDPRFLLAKLNVDPYQVPRHPHSENAPTTVASSTYPRSATLSAQNEDPATSKRGVPSITSSNQVQTPLHTPPESPSLGTRDFASSPEPLKDGTPSTVVGETEELSDEDARLGAHAELGQRPHIKIVDRKQSEEVLGRLAKMTKKLSESCLTPFPLAQPLSDT